MREATERGGGAAGRRFSRHLVYITTLRKFTPSLSRTCLLPPLSPRDGARGSVIHDSFMRMYVFMCASQALTDTLSLKKSALRPPDRSQTSDDDLTHTDTLVTL